MIIRPGRDHQSTASWYVVSVDLGQQVDPTAIAVLEVTTRQEELNKHLADPDAPSPVTMDWYPKGGGGIKNPGGVHRIDVRHLERLPLKMAYPDQIAHVRAVLQRPPLDRPSTDLVLDQTGVGKPIVDMFRAEGLSPIGITITAGDDWSKVSHEEFRVSKLLLVSRLQAMLHAGELRIAKGLADAQVLTWELQDFRAQITESGYTRFGARSGTHDDLVLALAIGAWWANRPRDHYWIGTFRI